MFLQRGLGTILAMPLFDALRQGKLDAAAGVLAQATLDGLVKGSALYVRQGTLLFHRTFGESTSIDDIFLLASISKPMSMAAVMTLYDHGEFRLNDPVKKFIPEFVGDRRDVITMGQLMTHLSGLPDQLPQNQWLRQRRAKLSEFVEGAIKTPLLFEPGSQYRYSSMGILLAAEVAQRISDIDFPAFVDTVVFKPLEMRRSALGLGRFTLEETIRCQVLNAAPESGAGDPTAESWDWNSLYWRGLGAPWGGAHASAPDVAAFLGEFLHPSGRIVQPETARLMVHNHNPSGLTSRGLGFDVGTSAGSPGCSENAFGHSGATGTLAWADPASDTTCVVLTTLPSQAVRPHPGQTAADRVAEVVR